MRGPHRYRPRAGALPGLAIKPDKCAAAVSDGPRSMSFHQCPRKQWRDDWCKQHHPDSARRRIEKCEEAWRRDWEADEKLHELERARCKLANLLAEKAALWQHGKGCYPSVICRCGLSEAQELSKKLADG